MNPIAVEQYRKALKEGKKYYKAAIARGAYPYPPALDDILCEAAVAGYADLGLVNIPANRITGTKTVGRGAALAGNFMPLLEESSEFGLKWMDLCDAHLGEEGIRDPVRCYEYLGRFYIQEGNKRVSVLLSFQSPSIPALVTRVIPLYSDELPIRIYYEFMRFYALSGQYDLDFSQLGQYAKLQAALGFPEDHVWTADERRSFRSGYARFQEAFDKLRSGTLSVTCADALLVWLQVYSFGEIKELSSAELMQRLSGIWSDVEACAGTAAIELSSAPEEKDKSILSKLLGLGKSEHLSVAFVYAFSPKFSLWTRAHDEGRKYLESVMADHVNIKTYTALDHDYDAALHEAIANGAALIFTTTPSMIGACRRAAAQYPKVKILNCALSQPYTGVRMYYTRIYECKFITGAIAGAMAKNDTIGYVANYPIFGVPASVNAFALGARLTNPRARIKLAWSCLPGSPVQTLLDSGAAVISNREADSPGSPRNPFEIGTYLRHSDGSLQPLAVPLWNWGRMYERIVQSVLTGVWEDIARSKAINYWWGLDSGVVDVQFDPNLPDGVCTLGWMLKSGIANRSVRPFQTRILDQNGVLRNDGLRDFTPEEIMTMDWFCDNIDGSIPGYEALRTSSRDLVRTLGLYRDSISPEIGGKQL